MAVPEPFKALAQFHAEPKGRKPVLVALSKSECFLTAKAWNRRTRRQVGERVLTSNLLPVVYYKTVGVQDTSEPMRPLHETDPVTVPLELSVEDFLEG